MLCALQQAVAQVNIVLPCQTDENAADLSITDATIGLDRKNFNNSGPGDKSEGYLNNFTLPPDPGCSEITEVQVDISIFNVVNNAPGACPVFDFFINVLNGCGNLAPASCPDMPPFVIEVIQGPLSNTTLTYSAPPQAFDFGDIFSVDLIPAIGNSGCPNWQSLVSDGFISIDYEICVTVTIDDLTITSPVDLGPPTLDICNGTTTLLDAGSYALYAWDPNGETTQTINVGDGTYAVTVTDSNGCTDSDEIVISEDSPTVSITAAEPDLTVCPGTTTTLTAVHNGNTVQWNTNESTTTITVGQGAYDVTVTDANNCTALATISIGQHTPPTATIDPANASVCDNGTTTIVVLENGLQYDWSTTATTQSVTVGPGNYMVTVTDGNGCTNVASTTVTNVNPPFAGNDNTLDVCNDGQTYDLVALLGSADAGGMWVDLDGSGVDVNIAPSNTDFTGVAPNTYVFRYEVSATAPCVADQAFITVEVFESLLAGQDYSDQICFNTIDYDLEAQLGIFDPGGTWVDLDGAGVSLFDPTLIDFTGVAPGIYGFAYEHGPSFGCNGSDAVATIEIVESPDAGLDNSSTLCTGATLTLTDLLSFGADLSGVFTSTSAAVVGDEFVSAAVGPGIYDVSYVVTALAGFCPSDTANFVIEVSNAVSAGLDTMYIECDTSTVALVNLLNGADLGGTFTPLNSSQGFANDSVFVQELDPGTYQYQYVVGDGSSCPGDTSTVTIQISDQPSITVVQSALTLCANTCQSLTFANQGDSIPSLTIYLLDDINMIVDSVIVDISAGSTTLSVCETLGTTGIENDTVFVGLPSGLSLTNAIPQGNNPCSDLDSDTISITTVSAIITTIDTMLCPSDTLVIGGVTFTGQNINVSDTISGTTCDSIVDIRIMIVDSDTIEIIETLCFDDTLRLGTSVYTRINPVDTIINATANGCDSVTIVDLTFLEEISSLVDDSLCEGDSIVVNGITYNSTNPNGREVLTSINLCDSIVLVDLTFGTNVELVFDDTLCADQSISVGGVIYDSSNPSASFVIPAPGCDTSVTVDLTFVDPTSDTISDIVCSDEVVVIGSDTYDRDNPSGTTILSSAVAPFCDSSIVVNLVYRSPAISMIDTILCEGEALPVGTDIYDTNMLTGTTLLPGAGAGGCDSMVNVALTYEAVYNDSTFASICRGDSILVNGVWLFDAGSYPEVYVSVSGCDSIITTVLTVNDCSVMVSVSSQNIDCAGTATGSITVDVQSPIDPPFAIEISSNALSPRAITIQTETGNANFDNLPSGLYTVAITDAGGTVVYLSTVTITEPINPVSVTAFVIDAPTCDMPIGDLLATATGGASPYVYLWSNGGDNPQQEELVPGTYAVTVTDANDCTATSEIVIDAGADIQAMITTTDPTCTGLADGVISVTDIAGGEAPYIVLINGVALLSDSLINLTDGLYSIVIFDNQQCTLEVEATLMSEAVPLIDDFQTSFDISAGDSVLVSLNLANEVVGLSWSDGIEIGACMGCESFTVTPASTTSYEVIASDANGCQEVVNITVNVTTPRRTQANIFSPNGDSNNEDFTVYAAPGSISNTLTIYDKWGNTVMSRTLPTNTNSWDGNNNGTQVANGVYIYVLNSISSDGRVTQEIGQVTVLR